MTPRTDRPGIDLGMPPAAAAMPAATAVAGAR